MKRVKKNTSKNLYQLNKATVKAHALKREVRYALNAKARTEQQAEELEAEYNYLDSLVEYLTHQVINAKTIEQLNENKDKYREFKQRQVMRLDERLKAIDSKPYFKVSFLN